MNKKWVTSLAWFYQCSIEFPRTKVHVQTNMSIRVYIQTHIHTCRWISCPHDMYTQTHCHTYSRLSQSIEIVRCMCPEIEKKKIVAAVAAAAATAEIYILWTWNALPAVAANNEECFCFTHPYLIVFVPPITAHAPSNRPFDRFIHLNGFGLKWRAFPYKTIYTLDLSLVVSLAFTVCRRFCAYSCLVWFVIHPFYLFPHIVRWVANAWRRKNQHRFSRSLSCETNVRIRFLFAPDMDFLFKCSIQINH